MVGYFVGREEVGTNVAEYVRADIVEALRADLARAVEALERLCYLQSGGPCTGIQSEKWLSEARDTLASIKDKANV